MAITDGLAVSQDSDLARRVFNYLLERGVPALRNIEVSAENGQVTLRGQVNSYYQKQLCLSCCRRVAGVVTLVDEIDVTPASRTGNSSGYGLGFGNADHATGGLVSIA